MSSHIFDKKESSKLIEENTDKKTSTKKELIIWWEEDLPYKLWHCCRRKLTSDIVAHINWKWIITIHKRTCKVLKWVNKERLLSAYLAWTIKESILVEVDLLFKNEIWVLKELSDIIYSMWIDVDWISTSKISNRKTQINLKLKVLDYDYLIIDRFLDRVKLKFDESLYFYGIWWVKKSKENKKM